MPDNSCCSLSFVCCQNSANRIQLFFTLLLLFSGDCLMFKSQMFSEEDSDAFKQSFLYGPYISCYFRFEVEDFVDQEMLTHKNHSVEMNRRVDLRSEPFPGAEISQRKGSQYINIPNSDPVLPLCAHTEQTKKIPLMYILPLKSRPLAC